MVIAFNQWRIARWLIQENNRRTNVTGRFASDIEVNLRWLCHK